MTRVIVCRANARLVAALAIVAALAGCGSSGDDDNPERPTVVVDVDSQLVDVGQRYRMDASNSVDPTGRGLTFFWTLIPPAGSHTQFEDHCEDVPDEVCTENFDACSTNTGKVCTTNADCAPNDTDPCLEDFADSSPDCSTGPCAVGEGREEPVATFVADVPGPYTVRTLVESSDANDTGTTELDTYPSLYLLGSMFGFGGTGGALIGEFADAETFASGAVSFATNPTDGNLLLAIPGPPGRVREFSYRDGSDLGVFGETSDFVVTPVAIAFDEDDRIFIAEADGTVNVFDAVGGRFERTVGDVTAALEQVSAIVLSPVTGELLVVDGRAGQAVRRYDASAGTFLGVFGDIGTVATRASDLAFFGDPASAVFVADGGGELIRCTQAGTGCVAVAAASALLQLLGPTSVAVNPAADVTENDIVVADAVAKTLVACNSATTACAVFGETAGLDSNYLDVAFAPTEVPEPPPPPEVTTTTTTTTLP